MLIYDKILKKVENRLKYYFDDDQILVQDEVIDGSVSFCVRMTSSYGQLYSFFNHFSDQTYVVSLEMFELKDMPNTELEEVALNLRKEIKRHCSIIRDLDNGAVCKLLNSSIIKLADQENWKHINLVLSFTIMEDLNNA